MTPPSWWITIANQSRGLDADDVGKGQKTSLKLAHEAMIEKRLLRGFKALGCMPPGNAEPQLGSVLVFSRFSIF
jgi:hypothetical protein